MWSLDHAVIIITSSSNYPVYIYADHLVQESQNHGVVLSIQMWCGTLAQSWWNHSSHRSHSTMFPLSWVWHMQCIAILQVFLVLHLLVIFLHGKGFISPSTKQLSKWLRMTFWSNSRPCGSSPTHRAVLNAREKRPQSLAFCWRSVGMNCNVMVGSLDTSRAQICSTVDFGTWVNKLSYTFTVEYGQPMVDTVNQWSPPECSTWTNSSLPTTSNESVLPSSVFCRPGIPYLTFSRPWAALMMRSLSQRS